MRNILRSTFSMVSVLFLLACSGGPGGNDGGGGGGDAGGSDAGGSDGGGTSDGGMGGTVPWPAPVLIESGIESFELPRVASLPGGGAIVFWVHTEADVGAGTLASSIRSSTFDPATLGWSAAVDRYTSTVAIVSSFRMVRAGPDTLVLAWLEAVTGGLLDRVFAATYVSGSDTFAGPVTVGSHAQGAGVFRVLQLGADAVGRASAVWTYNPTNISNTEIWFSTYDVGSASWSPVADTLRGDNPVVTVVSSSESIVAYFPGGGGGSIDATVFDTGGALVSSTVGVGTESLTPLLTILPVSSGGAVLLFDQFDDTTFRKSSKFARYANGSWAAEADVPISADSRVFSQPAWARDQGGTHWANLGSLRDGNDDRLLVGELDAQGDWTVTTIMSETGSPAAVGAGSSGAAIVAWVEIGVLYASRGTGGEFERPRVVVNDAADNVQTTLDETGRGYVTYLRNGTDGRELWAGTLGPQE